MQDEFSLEGSTESFCLPSQSSTLLAAQGCQPLQWAQLRWVWLVPGGEEVLNFTHTTGNTYPRTLA